MTAQIAIFNKNGVSLASDTAVTVGKNKVFNSVQKIFQLSPNLPIGLMLFGKARICGVPFEIVIKLYAETLGSKKFPKLEDYLNDFLSFINGLSAFLPEAQERHYILDLERFYTRMLQQINIQHSGAISKNYQSLLNENISEGKKLYNEVAKAHIKSSLTKWRDEKKTFEITQDSAQLSHEKYKEQVLKLIKNMFKDLAGDQEIVEGLTELALLTSYKIHSFDTSGLVFVGFGEQDYFPRFKEVIIKGVVDNKVIYANGRENSITYLKGSIIAPFAQAEGDTVTSFIQGVAVGYKNYLYNNFKRLQGGLNESIEKELKDIPADESTKSAIVETITQKFSLQLDAFKKDLMTFEKKHYVDPIIEGIAGLPVIELANMAESMIKITSLSQRVALDLETVGSDVDVAVISKNDGLMWVKKMDPYERK